MAFLRSPDSPPTPAAIAISFAVMGLGLSLAMAIAVGVIERQRDEAWPSISAWHMEWAHMYERANDYPAAFSLYQQALSTAQAPEERREAGWAMVTFLERDYDGRPTRDKRRMLREYVLALADLDPSDEDRRRLSKRLYSLAAEFEDRSLWARSEALLAGVSDEDDAAIPLFLQWARLDALVAFDRPGEALRQLRRIEEAKERTEVDLRRLRLSRVIMLRRARACDAWFEAMAGYFFGGGGEDVSVLIRERLREDALALMRCGVPDIEVAALWDLSELALERGAPSEAVDRLYEAVRRYGAAGRARAGARLLDLLQEEGRTDEADALWIEMLQDPELDEPALVELEQRLATAQTADERDGVWERVDAHLRLVQLGRPASIGVLVRAAEVALEDGKEDRAERYLHAAEYADTGVRYRDEWLLLRATLEGRRGQTEQKIRSLHQWIALYAGHPREPDVRFQWMETLAQDSRHLADLVGGSVGTVLRFPRDPRGASAMVWVARHMERLELHAAAEDYYRRATLLGSLLPPGADRAVTARAMLGQARALMALGRDGEADPILRSLNAYEQWAVVWPESGPLWAAIAMRQGQYREAVRRWRQTCGPPSGDLVPYLFGLLDPEAAAVSVRMPSVARPSPGEAPASLVIPAVRFALDRLLADRAYDEAARLLDRIESDPVWSGRIETPAYRVRILAQLNAREPVERVSAWLELHAVESAEEPTGAGLLLPDELRRWVRNTGEMKDRVRADVF